MSKNYLVPTNIVVSTCAHFRPYFDGGNVCAWFWYKISLRWWLLELLENSIYYITSRVSFHLGKWWSHLLQDISKRWLPRLLTLHWIVQQHANVRFDHWDLSSFLPFNLKVNLRWEKCEDSPSTLKDDSLSELYSPTQSMALCSWFSRSIRSLSVSSFFFSLRIFIWARCSAYPVTSFSGTMYLSENFLIASLSPLTSSLSSSNNSLFWARGWIKSSGSWPLVRFAFQER